MKEDESRVAHIVWEKSSLSQQFHNYFMSTSSLLCCLLYIQNGSSDTGSEEGKHFYSITITYAQDCSGKHYPGEKGGRKARDWGGEGWGGSWHCYVSSHHVGLTDSNICAIICGILCISFAKACGLSPQGLPNTAPFVSLLRTWRLRAADFDEKEGLLVHKLAV